MMARLVKPTLFVAMLCASHTIDAFQLSPSMGKLNLKSAQLASRSASRPATAAWTMFETTTKTTKKAGLEGLKMELLELCQQTRVGIDSPEGAAEREKILALVEKIEKQNPTKDPLPSGEVDGEWTLRWTTSMGLLGLKRPRGFRVDLDRPILQRIDTANMQAVNVEPVTTFSSLFGGIKYQNTVEIDLEPVTSSRVDAILNKFSFALFDPGARSPGLLSFPAPVKARGFIDTTYVDNARTVGPTGKLRISRGNDGNVFILTKNE
mmetsp:Transcript_63081/g.95212  ORF Transcript_63081/g.95212 Transcript_63081/m.95212 type:complete len:265 (-) Transcript_63081:344-1138(-)